VNLVNMFSFKKEDMAGIITVSFINIYNSGNFEILGRLVYCMSHIKSVQRRVI
jgi:hypothetical protein